VGKGIRQNRFVRSQKGLALKVRRVDLRGEGLRGSRGGLRTGKAGLPPFLFPFFFFFFFFFDSSELEEKRKRRGGGSIGERGWTGYPVFRCCGGCSYCDP